jgi:hypothetical protein
MRKIAGAAALLWGLLVAGCNGELVGGGQIPAKMVVISGDLQSGMVGTELQQPLVVRVVDDRDRPVKNQLVNFVVIAGGGSVFAGSAITNADGEARERWTLGTVAGDTQRVEARAVDPSTGQALVFAVFRAIGTPGGSASLSPWYNGTLGGAVSSPLADSVAVVVRDSYGNTVPGASVTWSAASGTGTFSPATSVSDSGGRAWAAWTLGPEAGIQVARASLPGTTATLDVPVNAGTQLRILAGDDVLTHDGTLWERPTVALSGPNPMVNGAISNARVSWTVESGGGTVPAPFTHTTAGFNASAQVDWTLGATGTSQRMTARVGNLAVTFNAVRPLSGSLPAGASAGGRVLDTDGARALVVDSAGGTFSLRIRNLATGGDVPVASGADRPMEGVLFATGALFSLRNAAGAVSVHEWRGGTRTALGTAVDSIRHEGDWVAWEGPWMIMRRNLATAVSDSMSDGQLRGVLDVSGVGYVAFTRNSVGVRALVWLQSGLQFVGSGISAFTIDGDVLYWDAPDGPAAARLLYSRPLSASTATLLYTAPAGQSLRIATDEGWVAWTEQGNRGCAFVRRSPTGTLSRFGRAPFTSPAGQADCTVAVAPDGAAAYLYSRDGAIRLLLTPGPGEELRELGAVAPDARVVERNGKLYLLNGASVHTLT